MLGGAAQRDRRVRGGQHWTDYLGEQPYVDCKVELDANNIPVVTEQTRYLAGFGVHAQQDAEDPNTPVWYLHGDLLRSAMLLTDEAGQATETLVYTAFGEPVTPDGQGGWRVGFPPASETRYQYAGGWGYESGLITLYGANPDLPPITLQHVGWRWCQPDIGRFVQRDPIGIGGGLNCYWYCRCSPLVRIDPTGTCVIDDLYDWIDYVVNGPPLAAGAAAVGVGATANYKWRFGIGWGVNRATAVGSGAWIGWNAGKVLVCAGIDRPIGTAMAGVAGAFDPDYPADCPDCDDPDQPDITDDFWHHTGRIWP